MATFIHTLLIAISSYVLRMDTHLDASYFTEFHKDLCWDQSYTYYILHPLQMLLKSITCLIIFTQMIRKSICPSFHHSSYIVTLDEVSSTIEACVSDINEWMTGNKLKLNNDKTELLILHAHHRPSPSLDSVYAGTELIKASESVRNIGVWFDRTLLMKKLRLQDCLLSTSTFSYSREISILPTL